MSQVSGSPLFIPQEVQDGEIKLPRVLQKREMAGVGA
jgi:hypothetical protein